MISYPTIRICLADIKNSREADQVFTLIEQGKSVINAAGCKCLDISYSNELDKCINPRGDMAILTFKVGSMGEEEREFETKQSVYNEFGTSYVQSEVVLRRKTNEKQVCS